jgi:type II secretory pathway pseudopilin PulG
MNWCKRAVTLATALALLAACADTPDETKKPRRESKRQSPIAVPAPVMPAGTFDRAKEQAELSAARSARAAGDNARASALATAAIAHWPGDNAAWEEYQTNAQALNDDSGVHYATFFRDKIDYVNPLPPRVAVLGFQNIAEQKAGSTESGYTYDQRSIDMGRRMWAFYNTVDPITPQREAQAADSILDTSPLLDMTVFGLITAGALTAIKSAANGSTK